MRPSRASDVQLAALRRLAAVPPATAVLVRRPGGFWCVADSIDDVINPRAWTEDEFSIGIQTVRAMERRGLVVRVGRVGRTADYFDDPRVITDLGRRISLTAEDR